MQIERKCLQCNYCAEDTTPQPQQLIGQRRYLCLFGPISSSLVMSPQGLMAIAGYPAVNESTISCALFNDDPEEDENEQPSEEGGGDGYHP